MLVAAAARGLAVPAARLALLIGERGLGGRSVDADERLRQLARERSPRAESARRLADRWARAASAGDAADQAASAADSAGEILALAFPDRVARRRGAGGAAYLMANGRAVTLAADDPLASAEWLVVADASGAAAGARLLLGAAIDPVTVERRLADRIETRAVFAFDPGSSGVIAETSRRLGAITLARQPMLRPDPARVSAALLHGVRQHGLALLPWGEASAALRARIGFARANGMAELPDAGDAALLERLDDWLAALLAGKRRLGELNDPALAMALAGLVDWPAQRRLDSFAPTHFETPAGSRHVIDYGGEAGPAVDVRVQALFGLSAHPMVAAGLVPLTLRLTSPAGRPIQVTRDLPRFWAGSWAEVRKDLRGRYPRHPWPADPATAPPTLRTKRHGA